MSTIQYSDIDAILEKVIRRGVSDQLSKKATAYKMAKADSAETPKVMTAVNMANKTFNIPVRVGRNGGVLGYVSGGQLNHGKPTLAQGTVTAKLIGASMEMDKFTLSVKDSGSAAGSVMAEYGKMLSQDLIKGMNRMLHRTSSTSGTIGTANATTSGTSLVLAAVGNGTVKSAKFVAVGDYVKIGSQTTVQVTAVDVSTNTLTLSASRSWTAADNVVVTDPLGNASDELTSLAEIVNTGSFQGINNSAFAGTVDSSTTTITDAKITDMILQLNEFGTVNLGLANRFVYGKVAALLTSLKKTANTGEALVGGFTGLEYSAGDGRVVIALDYDCPDNRLYLLDTTSLMRGVMQDIEWEDNGNGSKAIRKPDYFERQAVLSTLWNLGVINRSANGVFTGITG